MTIWESLQKNLIKQKQDREESEKNREEQKPKKVRHAVPDVDIIKAINLGIAGKKMTRPEDHWFHSSGLGRCSREPYWNWIYGKPNNKKGEFPPSARWSLEIGKKVHDLLEGFAKKSPLEEVRQEVRLEHAPTRLRGSCDLMVIHEGFEYLVEFKTTNSRFYEIFKRIPKEDHIMQLQSYLFMSNIQVGYIVYFNKDNNQMVSHRIDLNMDYVDREIIQKINHQRECIEKREMPTKFLSCPSDDPKDLKKSCPNYLRCKNYKLKNELPKEIGDFRLT